MSASRIALSLRWIWTCAIGVPNLYLGVDGDRDQADDEWFRNIEVDIGDTS
ncbi:MAG: hypothetical protein M2R45_02179 [Verrucomicrobia subdivision 3 bacterium]|nr:hypothetical protein [Limisphaerales bacterium]MCS1413755.1 hypothetical protein [Limisphaerales bacterium]